MANAAIGVVAIQGGFAAHGQLLRGMGWSVRCVRTPDDLQGLSGIVLPGGESTAQRKGMRASGLWNGLVAALEAGLPALGTCAGLILLSGEEESLGRLDVRIRRNGFGPQSASFASSQIVSEEGCRRGLFIRAPRIERVGSAAFEIAWLNGEPVGVCQGATVGLTFHPELVGDDFWHRLAFGAPNAARAAGAGDWYRQLTSVGPVRSAR